MQLRLLVLSPPTPSHLDLHQHHQHHHYQSPPEDGHVNIKRGGRGKGEGGRGKGEGGRGKEGGRGTYWVINHTNDKRAARASCNLFTIKNVVLYLC